MNQPSDNIPVGLATWPVPTERRGQRPRLLPGDIVWLTRGRGVGVIIEAQTIFHGSASAWNDSEKEFEHAREFAAEDGEKGEYPSYHIDSIPGFKAPSYIAWYRACEFQVYVPGPLHHFVFDK